MHKKNINDKDITQYGTSILFDEIRPLSDIESVLQDESFAQIIKYILDFKGRVIVTGIGKSGIIGRKFSTTLSSTGTPSFFLHPSEASHGDLGMIAKGDVIFALSRSGNTDELGDILSYSLKQNNPIFAITFGPKSRLASSAKYVLGLPNVQEAGHLSTPSTSTLIQLIVADCVALTLAYFRGFSDDLLSFLHPGGHLGKLLIPIDQLMSANMPLVDMGSSVQQAIPVMKEFGTIGIVDKEGILIGILTDGDIRRHSLSATDDKVEHIMTSNPISVLSGTLAGKVLHVFKKHPINAVFVVKDQKPVGLVHIQSLIKNNII